MQLTGAGFTEEQTEALFDVYGDERESLVTKADLEPLATKEDLQAFATRDEMQAFATKDDLQALRDEMQAFATKDDLRGFATKADIEGLATKQSVDALWEEFRKLEGKVQALELRLTLRFGGMLAVGVGVLAVIDRL